MARMAPVRGIEGDQAALRSVGARRPSRAMAASAPVCQDRSMRGLHLQPRPVDAGRSVRQELGQEGLDVADEVRRELAARSRLAEAQWLGQNFLAALRFKVTADVACVRSPRPDARGPPPGGARGNRPPATGGVRPGRPVPPGSNRPGSTGKVSPGGGLHAISAFSANKPDPGNGRGFRPCSSWSSILKA